MAIKEEELPGPGKEIATVFKLNIAWLRDALAVVGIKVDNLTEPGECKAALIKYYQGLNTAESEVEATKALRQEVEATKAALADQIRAKEVVVTPSPSAVSSSHALRAKGTLLKNAPSPHKTAGLNWKATSPIGLGLMAGSLRTLMSLIGKAWPDRLAMLHWRDLGDLPQKLINNTADKPAPLIQTVLYLQSEYLETHLLTLQNACAELPEYHPLREALASLDSHARTSGANDGYFWLLKHFGAYSAPGQLDELPL
eukprot:CAMPEP_0172650692 /NCGR_PEP_ID=MMETSP1068-20121228/242422_1 /TAXON_ID=35684 /ORGANISM="Pseudopedinella elastica, Strain CCMP716" /LENGTH=255 /DNA_ID=CAMNT_0013465061 /DNA_START=818 /DNA_END=1586 /DNA_ORIENTATION=+